MGALPDYLRDGLDVLLVGINPGMHSAASGHHFAGPGNRFWPLLHESGLTKERLGPERDHELLGLGIGLTNIVARATRGSGDLSRADFESGRRRLARKIERHRPRAVGFVGVTVFRAFWPEISQASLPSRIECGLRPETIGSSAVFVLPNPSGRNAHYRYDEMLACFRSLRGYLSSRGP